MIASYVSLPPKRRLVLQSANGLARAAMHTRRLMVSSALAWLTCEPICKHLIRGVKFDGLDMLSIVVVRLGFLHLSCIARLHGLITSA